MPFVEVPHVLNSARYENISQRNAAMKPFLFVLFPVVISFSIVGLLWSITALFFARRKRYRSPLVRHLLRGPGYSLSKQIDVINENVDSWLVTLFVFPFVFLSSYALSGAPGWLFVAFGTGFVVLSLAKLVSSFRKRFSLRLGLECEMAQGQELNQLMQYGYRVYHDFPADGFNIDHILIGPNGVFGVESKGRPKPKRGQGGEDAKVVYDGEKLYFPGWTETKPIEQAKRQAIWLSHWLTEVVGEKIVVYPVLALPGWFVERKRRDLPILNGKDSGFITRLQTDYALSEQLVKRISYQVEQRCRDVEPNAYEFRGKNK